MQTAVKIQDNRKNEPDRIELLVADLRNNCFYEDGPRNEGKSTKKNKRTTKSKLNGGTLHLNMVEILRCLKDYDEHRLTLNSHTVRKQYQKYSKSCI